MFGRGSHFSLCEPMEKQEKTPISYFLEGPWEQEVGTCLTITTKGKDRVGKALQYCYLHLLAGKRALEVGQGLFWK